MEVPEDNAVELRCYFTWMGEDGIARTKVKENAEIELKDAQENSEVVNGLSSSEHYPIIVDSRDIKSISRDARDHFSIRNRQSKVTAIALVRDKRISNMIGNFFIGINSPAVPVKLFSNEAEAVIWCKSHLR